MRTRRYIPGKMQLLLMVVAMLGGCTKEELGGGEPLPEGKYPLEFTSQMYGMEVTRATPDSKWNGDEEIAIRVGSDTRKYTVSDKNTGKITAAAGVVPFYWTSTTETKTVSAYYPYALAKATQIEVKTTQSVDADYQASDALYAAAATIAFSATPKELTFKHLPVKVVANLKAGDGVTPADVQGATVKFVSQSLTASFNSSTGVVTAATPGSFSVVPNAITSPATGFNKSVQALLVPCQMQNKQFIEVTIGSDKFYYTPTTATDGLLESGKVCTYEITVKRNDIEVKLTESGEWTNGGNDDVQSRGFSMKFRIDLTSYSSDKTYILPFKTSGSTGSYTLTVDWGDGSTRTTIPSGTDLTAATAASLLTHSYNEAKEYTITINTTQENFSAEQIPGFKPGNYRTTNNNNLKLKSLLSPLLNTGETDFSNCFANCASLTSLLIGLFDYNTEVTNFASCFALDGSTPSSTNGRIPAKLFAKHLKATNFQQCFQGQTLLLLISDIFCEETPENMQNRFAGQTVNFANCFDKVGKDVSSTFSQTAPALWDYGRVSFTSTECFKDHHNTKVTNASSIPAGWK